MAAPRISRSHPVLRAPAPGPFPKPVVLRQKASQLLRAQVAAVQAHVAPVRGGGVVQRLAAHVFAVRELGSTNRSHLLFKVNPQKDKINSWINDLAAYEAWENRYIEWAPYHLPETAYGIYEAAVKSLDDLLSHGAEIVRLLTPYKAQAQVKAFLDKCAIVIAAMQEDRANHATKQQEAYDDYRTLRYSDISVDNYRKIKRTGHMGLRAVKWWRTTSSQHPGHNFELLVMAGGQPWATVHIYWDVGKNPAVDDSNYGTFKEPSGASFYGGNFWDADLLADFMEVARRYLGSLPPNYSYTNSNV